MNNTYTVNNNTVRYSVRLRSWVVNEEKYFTNKSAAFRFATTGEWEVKDIKVVH